MFFIACGDSSRNILNFNKLSQFSSLISRCSLLLVAIPLGTFLISINWLNFILSSLDVLYCLWQFLWELSLISVNMAQFSSLISRCSLLLVAIPLGTFLISVNMAQFSSLISRCSLLLVAIPLGTFLISVNMAQFYPFISRCSLLLVAIPLGTVSNFSKFGSIFLSHL